ncbi:hypothetical protein [Paraburkholderia youngii]|uniref:hypothetical protein n=1 Tax=Paraburkholderia youngii TaxID=2782701 RepID=UPI003D24D9E2
MNSNTNASAPQNPLKVVEGLDLDNAAENAGELASLLAAMLLQHGYEKAVPANVLDLLAAANRAVAPAPAEFLVIQEAGSTGEAYAHVFFTAEDAEFQRLDCAKAAYRTSEVIEVPGLIARQPAFMAFVDRVAVASQNLEQPQSPAATIAPEDKLRLNVWAIGEGDCDAGGIYSVEFEEVAAAQPLAVRAAAALDIFFATHEGTVARVAAGGDYLVHVVDHSGNVLTPDAASPFGKWGRFGSLDLIEDDADDLSARPNAWLASHVE